MTPHEQAVELLHKAITAKRWQRNYPPYGDHGGDWSPLKDDEIVYAVIDWVLPLLAPDAAPLAALAMRDAAAERVQLCADYIEEPMTIPQLADLAKEIREIPLPDEAALTAAALTLPKVKALVDAAEWQPISTAPKDGTAVLLFFAMRAAEYDKGSGGKLESYRLQALSVEVGFFQGGEWCEAGTGHDFFEEWRRSDYPTHWMPLPAPPDTALTPASKGSPK